MPLVRISLPAGKSGSYRTEVSIRCIKRCARRWRFRRATGSRSSPSTAAERSLPIRPTWERTADFISIQIFLSRGRTTETKQALYRSIAQRLATSPGIRPDDVMIVLTEVGLEDWSFGRGEAQYVLNPPAWAKKVPA